MELELITIENISQNIKQIKSRIDFLNTIRESIKYHDDLYYKKAAPLISDYEYDKMVESYNNNLSKFESEVDVMKTVFDTLQYEIEIYKPADSALLSEYKDLIEQTLRTKIPNLELKVGSSLEDTYEKRKHDIPMLSLSNSYSAVDVKAFIESNVDTLVKNGLDLGKNTGDLVYFIEDKIDGISCSITYIDGKLEWALTRGDGETGEVITRKLSGLTSVPSYIENLGNHKIEVRGEVIINNHDWDSLKMNSDYKNQRNSAAGIVRSKSSTLDSYLTFVAYDIFTDGKTQFISHEDKLESLNKMGFDIPNSIKIDFYDYYISPSAWSKVQHTIEDLLNSIKSKNKKSGEYLIDGAVIKMNNVDNYETLGRTSKFPKWATSFKYKDDVYETSVLGITWQVGRTGKITPVAEIDPVEIDGSVVSRATLHNIEQMVRLGNVRVGKSVEIIKSAAVIPKILRVVDHFIDDICCTDINYDEITYPKTCPSCGSPVRIDGPELQCDNVMCRDRIIQSIVFYCQRDYMNIEGISDKIVTKLFDLGYVKTVADLYKLKDMRDVLIKIPGYGPIIIDKLLANIEKSKNNDIYRLMAGLGYKSIGRTISKLLFGRYGDLQSLAKATESELLTLSGIGDKTIQDVMVMIRDIPKITSELIEKFNFNTKFTRVELKDSTLQNKTFVLTGKFLDRTRKEYEHEIKIRGGKTSSSVSTSTDYIVVGEEATKHKVDKAITLGVESIGETALQDMFEN